MPTELQGDLVLPDDIRPHGRPDTSTGSILVTGATGFLGSAVLAEDLPNNVRPSSLPLPNPQRKNAADAIRSGVAAIRATATATAAAIRNATFLQLPKSSSI